MIRLSVKGLAKYITSSPAAQLKVLQDFKYAAADGPFAMRMYYREARDRIRAFHRDQRPSEWLGQEAKAIRGLAGQKSGPGATRLRHNARAVDQYEQYFGARGYEVLDDLRFRLAYAGVVISVAPDLHVRESKSTKMIKVQYGGPEPSLQVVGVMTQCLLAAARSGGHEASCVVYMDLPRGVEHSAVRPKVRTMRDVEAACKTISQIWASIPPPRRTSRRSAAA